MWVLLVLLLTGVACQDQASAERVHDRREPECTEPCVGGKCVAPEECQCLSGHQFVNGSWTVCEPICSKNCGRNARCTAPETCTCNEGYVSLIDIPRVPLSCISNCEKSCVFGDCVEPNECRCYPGYRPSPTRGSMVCEPVCSQDCGGHGRCIAPEICIYSARFGRGS